MRQRASAITAALALFGSGLLLVGCQAREPEFPIRSLDSTRGFVSDATFQFTISPDDRWIVYFENQPGPEAGKSLVVYDLAQGSKQEFALQEGDDEYISLSMSLRGSRCWSTNSRCCAAPPADRSNSYARVGPAFVLDFADPSRIQLVRPGGGAAPTASRLAFPDAFGDGIFTCSDCQRDPGERAFLNQQAPIAAELHFGSEERTDPSWNAEGHNIASLDRRRIYYQKGFQKRHATLYEYDLDSKKERKLASFTAFLRGCTRIGRMRLSHDERYLAFQVDYGCTWVTGPDLYVMDLKNSKCHFVAHPVYYDVHWLSRSNRLYFHSCARAGACGEGDSLSYVDVE